VSKFTDALKAGVKAAKENSATYADREDRFAAAEKVIVCLHCGGDRFEERRAHLSSLFLEFLRLGWITANSTLLVCRSCSEIRWFSNPPRVVE
jgi:hypothetical protein